MAGQIDVTIPGDDDNTPALEGVDGSPPAVGCVQVEVVEQGLVDAVQRRVQV